MAIAVGAEVSAVEFVWHNLIPGEQCLKRFAARTSAVTSCLCSAAALPYGHLVPVVAKHWVCSITRMTGPSPLC